MVEKKFVVDGLKLSYNGTFDIIDFFKNVENWISENNKEKDIKKKLEHVEPKGKKVEWFLEIWEDINEWTRSIVRIQAHFTDVTELTVKKGNRKKRLNKGNVLITFDGILETDIEGKWQQKPWFYFLRAVSDRFLWKFHMNKMEDKLAADTYSLNNRLKEFFGKYKV
jgi:hypothetical protein